MFAQGKYAKEVDGKGKIYFLLLKNFICRAVAFLWLGKVEGRENIPRKGPFVVVVNHQSFLDFMLVIFLLRRFKFLSFFIKPNYYQKPFLLVFLRHMGQVMAGKGCVSWAVEILRQGVPFVVFPEGTRTRNGKVGAFYPGGIVGLLSEMPWLAIVPVGIKNAGEIWRPGDSCPEFLAGRKIRLKVGKPLYFGDFKGSSNEFVEAIRRAVIKLVGGKG